MFEMKMNSSRRRPQNIDYGPIWIDYIEISGSGDKTPHCDYGQIQSAYTQILGYGEWLITVTTGIFEECVSEFDYLTTGHFRATISKI